MTYTANHPVDGDDIQTALSTYVNQNITHIVAAISQEHAWSNSDATATVHASDKFVGSTTRDMTAASGSVAITGVGFTSDIVLLVALYAGGSTSLSISLGGYDGTNNACIYAKLIGYVSTEANSSSTYSLILYDGATANQTASVSAIGVDGFTLAYTKTGSPTGTARIFYICLKLV